MERQIFFQDEVQFIGYGETDTYGAWIKFRLNDPEYLSLFRGQPSGKKTGKRFACVLVEIGDDEKPIDPHRTLSQKAFILTKNPNYFRFALKDKESIKSVITISENELDNDCINVFCDTHLKWRLGISSKKEIDSNVDISNRFFDLLSEYDEWCLDFLREGPRG